MKTAILAAIITIGLLTLGAVAVWYLVPGQDELVEPSARRAPSEVEVIETPTDQSGAGTEEKTTEDNWKTFELCWEMAPEEVASLARSIAEGAVPDASTLEALGAEALSKGYPAPMLDFTRNDQPVPYLATLLQEAALAYNVDAAQALLAAGADPNVNHSEVLFITIGQKTRGAPYFMLFPDFDESLPILRACLEAGADPNVRRYGFGATTPLYEADGLHNLGAMILLLEFGADPWLDLPGVSGFKIGSFIERMAFSSGAPPAAETLFRIARSGSLPQGPDAAIDKVFSELSSVGEKFASGTGPEARHTAWRLDQTLQVLGKALGREEEADAIRARLTAFDYEADGGWYLAEDEIHSRYDAPSSGPDKGAEIWGP